MIARDGLAGFAIISPASLRAGTSQLPVMISGRAYSPSNEDSPMSVITSPKVVRVFTLYRAKAVISALGDAMVELGKTDVGLIERPFWRPMRRPSGRRSHKRTLEDGWPTRRRARGPVRQPSPRPPAGSSVPRRNPKVLRP